MNAVGTDVLVNAHLYPTERASNSTLNLQFEILEQIGQGGMGNVFLGRERRGKKLVAIKMLREEFEHDSIARRRFQNEAVLARRLRHKNIVSAQKSETIEEKAPYLVMELLLGLTLSETLDEFSCLPANEVLKIGIEICEALQYAHDLGVLHRDLKPSNIMLLAHSKSVKVLDFGLATSFDANEQIDQSNTIAGSAFYLSPEQCIGEPADVCSEIYSVCCLLYEALTGVPPFAGRNVAVTLQMHRESIPQDVTEVRPELKISRAFANIVMRGLRKKPHERFQCASELKRALEALI